MRRAQDRARSARSRKNGARSATIKSRALGALKIAREARDQNVPAKRADFFFCVRQIWLKPSFQFDLHKSLSNPNMKFYITVGKI